MKYGVDNSRLKHPRMYSHYISLIYFIMDAWTQFRKYRKNFTHILLDNKVQCRGFCCSNFFHGATDPSGPGPPHYPSFTIALKNTPLIKRPLKKWSSQSKDLYLTTHNTHSDRNPCPWRDSNPQFSKRAAEDSRLRPCGYWDRLLLTLIDQNSVGRVE